MLTPEFSTEGPVVPDWYPFGPTSFPGPTRERIRESYAVTVPKRPSGRGGPTEAVSSRFSRTLKEWVTPIRGHFGVVAPEQCALLRLDPMEVRRIPDQEFHEMTHPSGVALAVLFDRSIGPVHIAAFDFVQTVLKPSGRPDPEIGSDQEAAVRWVRDAILDRAKRNEVDLLCMPRADDVAGWLGERAYLDLREAMLNRARRQPLSPPLPAASQPQNPPDPRVTRAAQSHRAVIENISMRMANGDAERAARYTSVAVVAILAGEAPRGPADPGPGWVAVRTREVLRNHIAPGAAVSPPGLRPINQQMLGVVSQYLDVIESAARRAAGDEWWLIDDLKNEGVLGLLHEVTPRVIAPGWIYTVASRRITDYLRVQRRQRHAELDAREDRTNPRSGSDPQTAHDDPTASAATRAAASCAELVPATEEVATELALIHPPGTSGAFEVDVADRFVRSALDVAKNTDPAFTPSKLRSALRERIDSLIGESADGWPPPLARCRTKPQAVTYILDLVESAVSQIIERRKQDDSEPPGGDAL